jgi:predicted MFS family arabinose efflux permease
MVVPLALASIWMARRYVPTTAPGGMAPNREGARLDAWGMLIATVTTLCLLNGLVALREAGLDAWHAWGLLMAAVVGLTLFIWWQHHLLHKPRASGLAPLMNLSVFGHRAFAMGSLVAFIYGAGLFGSTYLLPLYMQQGMGWSASYTGTALLPAGLMLAITIALTGRLADRHPTYLLVSSGLALLALSFIFMATLHVESSMWWLSAWVILGRIGLGLILPSLNSGSLRSLARPLIPQGSSVINFMRMLGGAAGVSVCAIVLQWRLAEHGVSLTSNDQAALRLMALNETFVFLALLMALALLAAWQLKTPQNEAE